MRRIAKIREYMKRTPVFDVKSIIRLAGDREYSYLLLNNLIKKGEVKRLTRGYYTTHNEPSLMVYCIKPAYIGLHDAMSFHNLWEQETVPVIITSRKARPGIREVLGGNVMVRKISPAHFFGYDYIKQGDFLFPVSDVEKTFIDMVYFGEMRKDLARLFLERLDRKKLASYLKRYDSRMAAKAMRFLPRF